MRADGSGSTVRRQAARVRARIAAGQDGASSTPGEVRGQDGGTNSRWRSVPARGARRQSHAATAASVLKRARRARKSAWRHEPPCELRLGRRCRCRRCRGMPPLPPAGLGVNGDASSLQCQSHQMSVKLGRGARADQSGGPMFRWRGHRTEHAMRHMLPPTSQGLRSRKREQGINTSH